MRTAQAATYELAASIAFHGLRLAVAGIVIGTTTLVASCGSVGGDSIETTIEATTEARTASATSGRSRSTHAWGRAVSCNMAHLAAGVTTAASSASGDAQRRTISLDVAETLAMIALFG